MKKTVEGNSNITEFYEINQKASISKINLEEDKQNDREETYKLNLNEK